MALEDLYMKLTIEDEEQGVELQGDSDPQENDEYHYCLVGRFLTNRAIHFVSMKSTMVSMWRPKQGVCIKDMGVGTYVFQLFHPIDMNRVLDNGPWTFNNHLLLLKHLKEDDNPLKVDVFETSFWVQIHEVSAGFCSERALVQIGNYIGKFLSSDPKNFSKGWKSFLRIRVLMDVRLPLKRKMKLKKLGGEWIWLNFKYERVPTFCFICSKIGHSDLTCETLYEAKGKDIEPRLFSPSSTSEYHWSGRTKGGSGDLRWRFPNLILEGHGLRRKQSNPYFSSTFHALFKEKSCIQRKSSCRSIY
ncbi:hypothetical protein Adt_34510 [Abeliophyllum distichum]|uniref:DUF4283 domain-containing protein n=1 Tax=Abeliophyllum distichum TaxID=126358 RepID=A0ABD1R0A4_9LAMI